MKKPVLKIMAMAAMLAAPVFPASALKEPATVMAAEGTPAKRSVKTYYVTSNTLNVRSDPGTDYSVLGSFTRGCEVKVLSIRGDKGNRWAKIRFQGLTAYVSVNHLAKK